MRYQTKQVKSGLVDMTTCYQKLRRDWQQIKNELEESLRQMSIDIILHIANTIDKFYLFDWFVGVQSEIQHLKNSQPLKTKIALLQQKLAHSKNTPMLLQEYVVVVNVLVRAKHIQNKLRHFRKDCSSIRNDCSTLLTELQQGINFVVVELSNKSKLKKGISSQKTLCRSCSAAPYTFSYKSFEAITKKQKPTKNSKYFKRVALIYSNIVEQFIVAHSMQLNSIKQTFDKEALYNFSNIMTKKDKNDSSSDLSTSSAYNKSLQETLQNLKNQLGEFQTKYSVAIDLISHDLDNHEYLGMKTDKHTPATTQGQPRVYVNDLTRSSQESNDKLVAQMYLLKKQTECAENDCKLLKTALVGAHTLVGRLKSKLRLTNGCLQSVQITLKNFRSEVEKTKINTQLKQTQLVTEMTVMMQQWNQVKNHFISSQHMKTIQMKSHLYDEIQELQAGNRFFYHRRSEDNNKQEEKVVPITTITLKDISQEESSTNIFEVRQTTDYHSDAEVLESAHKKFRRPPSPDQQARMQLRAMKHFWKKVSERRSHSVSLPNHNLEPN
ncbi:hypothetical protein RFI_09824 [Reticulomyxa filosa]|uniref:Uncharacterized protein n=1 Tax=Reticulomyxa filosa TaxID=46433 RepID=X6NPL0_RETFI|nr:hypothetical protein RFI_09824 [Reticulomyxa filosa]|eukprot:ETO27312.1 hypothetical protein RFI_09824 [Reticulomyxa filosa]